MADYEELIGAKFTFGDSLDQAQREYDKFIQQISSKGLQLKLDVSGGALDGITKQLDSVQSELSSLSSVWKEVFGTGAEAAQQATTSIKDSVASAESAVVKSQKAQTEAVVSQSKQRIKAADEEAAALKRLEEDKLRLSSDSNKAIGKGNPNSLYYGAQALQNELAKIEEAKAAQAKSLEEAHAQALKLNDRFDQQLQQRRKNAPLVASPEEEAARAQASGSAVLEKELARVAAVQAKARERERAELEKDHEEGLRLNTRFDADRQRRLKNAPYSPSPEEEFSGSYDSGSIERQLRAVAAARDAAYRENERREAAKRKVEEEPTKHGVGGFFGGLKEGFAPGGADNFSAAKIGEFVGQVTRFQLAWGAVGIAIQGVQAIIGAPFEVLKGGMQYLAEFQERASQLKATLLDHGFFSKDPAENLQLAGQAADALQKKIDGLADKLNVAPKTIQTAFEFFAGYGGNKLTGNLNESVDLAGYATAALQSQNPAISSRTVGTQLEKLTSGTLKDTDKLPAALGISADKLNAMAKGAQKTHDLLQQIEANAPGLADRIGSANERFESLTATAERFWQRLEGTLAKPTFDLLTEKLRELLKWLDANKDSIEQFATTLGNAVSVLVDQFTALGPVLASGLGTVIKNVLYNTTTLVEAFGHLGNAVRRIAAFTANGGAAASKEQYDIQTKAYEAADRSDQQLSDNSKRAEQILFGKKDSAGINRFLGLLNTNKEGGYTDTSTIPKGKATGNTTSDQLSAIRETYRDQASSIKEEGAAVRKAIDEDAKAFRITLSEAADFKEAAYQQEAERLKKAGVDAAAALARVAAGKDPAKTRNAKKALTDLIGKNEKGLADAASESAVAGQDAYTKQDDRLAEVDRNSVAGRQEQVETYLFSIREQLHQKKLISDAQYLKDEQDYWDKLYDIKIKNAKRDEEAEDNPVKKLQLHQKVLDLQQGQTLQNQTNQRHAFELPFEEGASADQAAVDRFKLAQENQQFQTDVDRHAGLTSTARRDNTQLARAQQGTLFAEGQQALGDLLRTKAEAANAGLTPAQIGALPSVQEKELKVQAINAQLVKAQHMDVETQGLSKEQAADSLFGASNADGNHFKGVDGKGLLGDLGQTAGSLGNLAKNVGGAIGAIEQGYKQGGVGGAVGAGLGQVGQFIPGPVGQAISGVGAVISTISSIFTGLAQEIGKQVAHAVEKAMEKFSTGQATLSDTLKTVQDQYNTLVAKETGRKGGQQVLDTQGVALQQQIDQLKQQQKQVAVNFADSTVIAGGTNSVAQQWLQTWISVNKEVQQYENAVGKAAGMALANKYLNEQLDQERKQLSDQYNQGQQQAVNDALQLNQLLQQRNNYEDQYRQQVFSLQSADSLARRGNPAEETARKISLAKAQYNQQVQQLNFEINSYQQKVDYEKQIFKLASDRAGLEKQALADQAYQLKEQMAQYQTVIALLKSITGLTATNGTLGLPGLPVTIPTGYGINDGSLNGIPGYGAPGTVDNSTNTYNVSIPASALPAGADPKAFANAINSELDYARRTRNIVPL